MALTGAQIYEKYQRRMGQASEDIKRGVETTTKSQSEEAIKAAPRMRENLNKALDAGKYEEGLRRSGDAKWKRNLIEKGIPKIAAGITANKTEITQQFDKVSAVGEAVKTAVASMPKGSIEDSLNRVRASMVAQKAAWNK